MKQTRVRIGRRVVPAPRRQLLFAVPSLALSLCPVENPAIAYHKFLTDKVPKN
jgi:hypothetical protein